MKASRENWKCVKDTEWEQNVKFFKGMNIPSSSKSGLNA